MDQYHTRLTSYFTHQDLPSDIVKITGPMFKEQKMFYTNFFLPGQRASAIGATCDDVVYSPTGCIATWALGAAGWDGCHISLVMSFDLLTDLISVVQEKGQAGRYPGASPNDNCYEVCVSLSSYTYHLRWIHRSSASLEPVSTRCNVDGRNCSIMPIMCFSRKIVSHSHSARDAGLKLGLVVCGQ